MSGEHSHWRGWGWIVLEQLQALVVQVEAGVACQVQLLQLGGQHLGQGHLGQLVAAQVHALRRRDSSGLVDLSHPGDVDVESWLRTRECGWRSVGQSFGFRERQIMALLGDYKGFPDLA